MLQCFAFKECALYFLHFKWLPWVVSAFSLLQHVGYSSNDHERRDDDRPDQMADIILALPSGQLNALYAALTNNARRTVFMDQLQDIVIANIDSILQRWGAASDRPSPPPQKAMPKAVHAKESTTTGTTSRPGLLLLRTRPTVLQQVLRGGPMWRLF